MGLGVTVSRYARIALSACVIGAGYITIDASASQANAQDLQMRLGGGTLTKTTLRPGTTITVKANQRFSDLVVGNPETADVVPLTDTSFYVQGKSTGFTNVSVYDEQKNLLGVLDVRVQQSSGDVSGAVRAAVPGANIDVSTTGGRITLSGVVADAVDRAKAIEAAQQFSDSPVISSLAVSDAQQVSLEVRVIEASRTVGKDLGIKLRAGGDRALAASGSGLVINSDPETALPTTYLGNTNGGGRLLNANVPFGTFVANVLGGAGFNLDIIIDALEGKGLARRLAQPNITTLSGEPAKFLAGGEVPVQVLDDGKLGVIYKEYGVILEFLPTVLDDSKINLRVLTEVSELDFSVSVNGNPGFTTRRAEAVMEMRSGQSFAMAGLLQAANTKQIEQVPWLGNIPILGALFRSSSFQKKETDLVIVVTPRLVRPASPDEQLYSPLDQTRPSNDAELFMLGLLEVDKDMLRKFKQGDGIIGSYGHRLDLEFEDPYVAKK